MGVAQKRALGVTVGLLVAGKVPDDQRLVATAREQHVGAIKKKKISVRTIVHIQSTENMYSTDIREYTRGRM